MNVQYRAEDRSIITFGSDPERVVLVLKNDVEARQLRDSLLYAHPLPKPEPVGRPIVARLYGPTGNKECEVRLPSYMDVHFVPVSAPTPYDDWMQRDVPPGVAIRKVKYRNVGPEIRYASGPEVYKFVYDGEG